MWNSDARVRTRKSWLPLMTMSPSFQTASHFSECSDIRSCHSTDLAEIATFFVRASVSVGKAAVEPIPTNLYTVKDCPRVRSQSQVLATVLELVETQGYPSPLCLVLDPLRRLSTFTELGFALSNLTVETIYAVQ